MSENRNDDAPGTGGRIGDLPASDKELGDAGGGSGARSPSPMGQPTPEATQPSPGGAAAGQPSPGGAAQPSPGGAQRAAPPEEHEPTDPEE